MNCEEGVATTMPPFCEQLPRANTLVFPFLFPSVHRLFSASSLHLFPPLTVSIVLLLLVLVLVAVHFGTPAAEVWGSDKREGLGLGYNNKMAKWKMEKAKG